MVASSSTLKFFVCFTTVNRHYKKCSRYRRQIRKADDGSSNDCLIKHVQIAKNPSKLWLHRKEPVGYLEFRPYNSETTSESNLISFNIGDSVNRCSICYDLHNSNLSFKDAVYQPAPYHPRSESPSSLGEHFPVNL